MADWYLKLLGLTGTQAEVDADNQLAVKLPKIVSRAGFAGLLSILDVASSKAVALWGTDGNKLDIAPSQMFWNDAFNATAQNTAKYRAPTTTQTLAFTGGFVTLNSAGIVTATTSSAYQTYRTFPIFGNNETRCIISGLFPTAFAPALLNVIELGLFTAALPGSAAPTDGVFFRYNAAGELRGIVSLNGVETQTAAIAQPATAIVHDFMILVQPESCTFWIDKVLVGTITRLTDVPGAGMPFLQGALPLTVRQYIAGVAPAAATKFQIAAVSVQVLGPDTSRTWQIAEGGMGLMGYQGIDGGVMGSSANYANSANPAAAVPTNTTAALGSGLGGQFWETDTLAVTTDGIISSFQNPLGGVNQTPRNLIVYGVTVDSYVQTALTGGGYNAQLSLAFGHTAVSLVTAEAATTKAPRRLSLGQQSVASGALALVALPRVEQHFQAPIVLAPGEFIQVVRKKVGTAPSAGVIAHMITFDAVFE